MSLKKELAKTLNDTELEKIKTSYDIVGDIAIIELEDPKDPFAKKIAEEILKANKNVRSIYRKDGGHGGEFRIQNYTYILGDKKTTTIHKENAISIELDINKVYYSPRSATERKRIFEDIKDGENVLVLFSGCGPFSVGASKNSKASHITSIEMNPDGHSYAIKNALQNKAYNTTFINIDAKKTSDRYYTNFIGLKSGINKEQIKKRLKHNPKILELHLFKEDLYENKKNLIKTIKMLQDKDIEVIIHMPFNDPVNGNDYHLAKKDLSKDSDAIEIFCKTCKENNIKGIIHPCIGKIKDRTLIPILESNIRKLKPYYNWLYFENSRSGIFSEYDDFLNIIKKTNIKNMCIDISHFGIAGKSEKETIEIIKNLTKKINTHFHVGNFNGKSDSYDIESGTFDIKKFLPLITSGVIEVCSKDEENPTEMIDSYNWLKKQRPAFDRIIMPLPKTSFDFLETIIPIAKKGCIVNFYCFIDENKIKDEENKIKQLVESLGKKIKIIKSTKCGQQSPRCYRVCVDFEIL